MHARHVGRSTRTPNTPTATAVTQTRESPRAIWLSGRFCNFEKYKQFIEHAKLLVEDLDDAPYIALALKLNCPIWTNDSDFKNQKRIRVLSTEEIIEILF